MKEVGEMIDGYALTEQDVLSREGEYDATEGVVEFRVSLKFKIPSFLRVEQGKNCKNIEIIFYNGQRLGAFVREVSQRKCYYQIFLEEKLVKKFIRGDLDEKLAEFIKSVIQEEQKLTKYIYDHPPKEM